MVKHCNTVWSNLLLLEASYLLHETCDIVNFIVDNEPCVSAHIMGLNLLSRVILHIVSFQCAVTLSLRVSFFTHLYLISVTLFVEIQSKAVIEQVCYHDIFCKKLSKTRITADSSKSILPPPVHHFTTSHEITQSAHSNQNSQSAFSSLQWQPIRMKSGGIVSCLRDSATRHTYLLHVLSLRCITPNILRFVSYFEYFLKVN